MSIIEQESKKLGVKIPKESIEYIAKEFSLDDEKLKSITFGLCAFQVFTDFKLKKYNSASVAMSVVTYNQPMHFIAQLVIDKVLKVYKVTEKELYSAKSTAVLVGVRNIITHILHDTFMASYRDIHRIIGHRAHTTVVIGNQEIREVLKKDAKVRKIVENIKLDICNELIEIQKDVKEAHRKIRENRKIEKAHEWRRLLGW